jgi:hypothetical protein
MEGAGTCFALLRAASHAAHSGHHDPVFAVAEASQVSEST